MLGLVHTSQSINRTTAISALSFRVYCNDGNKTQMKNVKTKATELERV